MKVCKAILVVSTLFSGIAIFAELQNKALTIALDSSIVYPRRAKSITRIGQNLTFSDIEAIHRFLEKKDSEGLSVLEINSLKNDLVLVLMQQKQDNEKLVKLLISMYQDKGHSITWRDYCLQFMGRIFQDSTIAQKKLLKQTLLTAIKDPMPSLAATAMIAITLNQEAFNLEQKLVDERVLCLLKQNIPSYVKVTLLQICALHKIKPDEILPILYEIIKTSKNIPLKISAIAALGEYRDRQALPIIAPLCSNSDLRIRKAANSAVKKLK